jgi:uncharacterized protein
MRKRHLMSIALLALLSASAAQAQQPSDQREALARQMLEAMRGEQMIEQFAEVFFQSLVASSRQQMAAAGTCPAAEQVLQEQGTESRQLMLRAFRDGDYMGKVAQIYARTFSEDELEDAIAFFRTPTGQKFLDKQPELMQQGAALGQAMVGAKQAELRALSTRFDASMRSALDGCKQAPAAP